MDTSGTRKGLILALTCMAQFMVVLDIAIVNVALPAIQQDLGLRQSALQWVVIAYGLLLGGFLAETPEVPTTDTAATAATPA